MIQESGMRARWAGMPRQRPQTARQPQPDTLTLAEVEALIQRVMAQVEARYQAGRAQVPVRPVVPRVELPHWGAGLAPWQMIGGGPQSAAEKAEQRANVEGIEQATRQLQRLNFGELRRGR